MAAAGPAQDSGCLSLLSLSYSRPFVVVGQSTLDGSLLWVQRAGVSAASHVKKQRRPMGRDRRESQSWRRREELRRRIEGLVCRAKRSRQSEWGSEGEGEGEGRVAGTCRKTQLQRRPVQLRPGKARQCKAGRGMGREACPRSEKAGLT